MAAPRLVLISIYSKLKVRQVTAIKSNYIVIFAAISLAQSNLGADSIAPVRRSFQKGYWPPYPWPTTRIGGGGRGLSIKPPYATNGSE